MSASQAVGPGPCGRCWRLKLLLHELGELGLQHAPNNAASCSRSMMMDATAVLAIREIQRLRQVPTRRDAAMRRMAIVDLVRCLRH